MISQKWSNSSDNYDGLIRAELSSFRVERWQNRILFAAPEQEVLNILDTGCGPGFFTMILADKGHKVTGIDGAEGMIRCAKENIRTRGYDAEILEMDCHELQFPNDTFILVQKLQH